MTQSKTDTLSAIETAIQEALDHGFKPNLEAFPEMEHFSLVQIAAAMTGDVFIDPAFWRALGKARRWTTDEDFKRWQGSVAEWKAQYWKTHWHALIDHLADGKDAESFFANLPPRPKQS